MEEEDIQIGIPGIDFKKFLKLLIMKLNGFLYMSFYNGMINLPEEYLYVGMIQHL